MKHTVAIVLLSALLLTMTWVFASEDISRDLSENIVRLHILANSDSEEDQTLKLTVRDSLLNASRQSPQMLSDGEIMEICQATVYAAGYNYPVSVERGRFYFPQKSYDNLTLPAGTYHALRIRIGNGSGQNWWCVMYPPLCFTPQSTGTLDEEALLTLKNAVKPETFSMVCESNAITIKPSFKLLELWQQLKAKIAD